MFGFINTKKKGNEWRNLEWLRKRNINGKNGISVIDIELYIKQAEKQLKDIEIELQPRPFKSSCPCKCTCNKDNK